MASGIDPGTSFARLTRSRWLSSSAAAPVKEENDNDSDNRENG
jgi:hypothetical protein